MAAILDLNHLRDYQSRLGMQRDEAVRYLHWLSLLARLDLTQGALFHARVTHRETRQSVVAIAGVHRDEDDSSLWWGCAHCDHRRDSLTGASHAVPRGYRMYRPAAQFIPSKIRVHRPTFILCPSCVEIFSVLFAAKLSTSAPPDAPPVARVDEAAAPDVIDTILDTETLSSVETVQVSPT